MDNRVSAVAVPEYDLSALCGAVERHMQALDVWQDLRPGMKVTLKPNLLARHAPEHAVTTHPAVVEAVTLTLQKHGVRDITLADSPGGPYTKGMLQSIYSGSGMTGVAERTGLHLNLTTSAVPLSRKEAELCREFNIITPVAEADYVINLCKLKTHAMVGYSGAVKNLFGCIPGLQKPDLHLRFPEKERFCRMLVDLSLLVRPALTFMDAVVGMEGNGPSAGTPRHIGQLFAARNPHALDSAVCDLIGLSKEEVLTLAHSIQSGLCPAAASELVWLCDGKPTPIANFCPPDTRSLSLSSLLPPLLRGPFAWVERTLLSPRPAIVKPKCIGCGKCAQSCAPKAITIENGKAVLNRELCIRCYCCHELCPVKAVRIRRAGL